MSARQELFHSIDASYQDSVALAAASADAGTEVDLQDCNGLLVHWHSVTSAPETGAGELALYESDDDITYTVVDADFVLGDNPADATLTGTGTEDSGVCSYIGYKRYVKFGESGLTDGEVAVDFWFTKHNLRQSPPSTSTV